MGKGMKPEGGVDWGKYNSSPIWDKGEDKTHESGEYNFVVNIAYICKNHGYTQITPSLVDEINVVLKEL